MWGIFSMSGEIIEVITVIGYVYIAIDGHYYHLVDNVNFVKVGILC
jgi:hypothetical protein